MAAHKVTRTLTRASIANRCREVHPEIREAVMTILWAGPRLEADLAEMSKICSALTARFGKVRYQLNHLTHRTPLSHVYCLARSESLAL